MTILSVSKLPLYQQLVHTWQHQKRMENMRGARPEGLNEFQTQVVEALDKRLEFLLEQLPSGSGFDSGVKVTPLWLARTLDHNPTVTAIFIDAPFHPMNENGFYEEWITARYTLEPYFIGPELFPRKHDLTPYAQGDTQILEYIEETLYQALVSEVEA